MKMQIEIDAATMAQVVDAGKAVLGLAGVKCVAVKYSQHSQNTFALTFERSEEATGHHTPKPVYKEL